MKNWKDLLAHGLAELSDAERQQLEALPGMAEAAGDPLLKQIIASHASETGNHVRRLERVADLLKVKLSRVPSEGMRGLLEDGEDLLRRIAGGPEIRDAALIGAAQKVERYEMVAYDSAVGLAGQLGYGEAAGLLQKTLAEEAAVSKKLAKLGGEAEPADFISAF